MIERIDLPERIREVAFGNLRASGELMTNETILMEVGT